MSGYGYNTSTGSYSVFGGNGQQAYVKNYLQGLRAGTEPYAKGAKISLVRREYVFSNSVSSPLTSTSTIVNYMQSDMDSLRRYGLKAILQVAYGADYPYGTSYPTTISKIMADMDTLSGFLNRNADVIAVYQMGWIGLEGECASDNGQNEPWLFTYQQAGYYHSDTASIRQLIQHYLSKIPTSRMLQLRDVRVKNWIWGSHWSNKGNPTTQEGSRLITSLSDTVTLADAFSASEKSRLGHYDDAFSTDPWDKGTFAGLPNSEDESDTTTQHPWYEADTKYVFAGGETDQPSDGFSESQWGDNGSFVMANMRRWHISFTNSNYYRTSTDAWRANGSPTWFCEMDRYMGYRFRLIWSSIPQYVDQGGPFRVQFKITNVGSAAAVNPRGLEIILRSVSDSTKITHFNIAHYRQKPYDPRYWFPGETVSIDTTITIPTGQPLGTYQVCLNLPDTCKTKVDGDSLYGRPEYSIRCEGRDSVSGLDVWQTATGFNDFRSNVVVRRHMSSYNGDATVESGQRKIARGSDGTLYLVYPDSGYVRFTKSADDGANWSTETTDQPPPLVPVRVLDFLLQALAC